VRRARRRCELVAGSGVSVRCGAGGVRLPIRGW